MMLNTKSADSAMLLRCRLLAASTRVNKTNILVTGPLGYLMYLTYIHTIVVQAARVQISCIPGMIITRFFRAVLLPDRSM